MEHSPDHTHPRDVKDFHPRDRAIVELIDKVLHGTEQVRRPGEIGAVLCRPSVEIDLLSESLEDL